MTVTRRNTLLGIGAVGLLICIVVAVWLGTFSTPVAEKSSFAVGTVGLGDIPTLDPHAAGTAVPIMIVWQVYDRLVEIGPDGSLSPMLATSWNADSTLQIWRFDIRGDVRFQVAPGADAGDPVTPADVRASVLRALRKPGYARTLLGDLVVGAASYIDGTTDDVDGLSVDQTAVTFRLTRPFAYLPERLAASFFSVVPANTPAATEIPPLGSGPFRFVNWDHVMQRVTLQRNDHYWKPLGKHCPERLTIQVIETEAAAVEEVRSGSLALVEATSSILPLLGQTGADNGVHAESVPTSTIRVVALNTERAPFRDYPELGVALNLATDRQAIVATLGAGTLIGGPIPEATVGKERWLLHNPTQARSIIDTIPPDARHLEMLVEPGNEPRIIAELLRMQWADVGIDLTLRTGLADFFPKVIAGDYQLAIAYYGPFVPSVDQYLWLYRADAQPIPNAMRFSDPGFEAAVNAFASTTATHGAAALDSALGLLATRPPVVWLIRAPHVQVTKTAIDLPRSAGIPLFEAIRKGAE